MELFTESYIYNHKAKILRGVTDIIWIRGRKNE